MTVGNVFLVGKFVEPADGLWEVVGIFTEKEMAEAMCTEAVNFVAEVPLNEYSPAETLPFPKCWYPRAVAA